MSGRRLACDGSHKLFISIKLCCLVDVLFPVLFHVSKTHTVNFVVLQSNPGVQMEVKSFINAKVKVANFLAVELMAVLKIMALITTRLCCPSGNKIIVFSMAYLSKEVIQQTFIDLPGLYSGFCINPFGKNEFYAIPHRSRQFHLLHVSLETGELQLMDARLSGHQLRKYGMNVTEHNILTYGLDGMVILHSVKTKDCIVLVIPHHRMDLGIKTAIASPLNTYIISLGQDGSMICTYTGSRTDHLKETSLSSVPQTKEICHMYTQRQTSGFTKMIGAKNARSWLELQEDIKVKQEAALWSKEKAELRKEFRSIQKECVVLLEKNYINPPEEKVPISAFHLDEETRTDKIRKTQNKCKEIELYLKALIVAQDKLCETLKQRYWNTVETKGRKLKAIMGETEVENYPLFPKDVSYEEELGWIIERRKLEVQMQEGNCFSPWDASDGCFEVAYCPSLAALHDASHARQKITSIGTMHEEAEEEQINQLSLVGSSSYHFIEPCAYHHNQFELATYHQMHNEIILLMDVCTVLRAYFNKHFDNIYALKEREMLLVTERNTRLRYILSELNGIWTEIGDPKWSQEEQPERLMKVEENEVGITPYISASQQEILDKLAAKAETDRLAQLADNFHEKALIAMMDGVLEVSWEDEIKKDIPKPKCMLEKTPEDYNEEDLMAIKDYSEKVTLRFNDRARYRKMLETEFHELSQTLKDDVMKFNSQLADLFLLKLKIEAAIGQETLKIERYKYLVHKRLCLNKQKKKLKMEVIKQESSSSALQEQIQQLQIWTNDCRATYDAVVAREKHLEKNFKKDFPEVSQVVLEQLLKFYRRRPNMHQHAQTSVILLNELSQWTVSAGRPSFLPPEHSDFLKSLDQIDSYSNSPAIINEEMWATLCRLRRMKVECELKAKCCALEVADSEHTVSVYQKLLAGEKQCITTLQDEIHKTKEQLLELQNNTELQIVMKQGLVEITTTGLISDFDDAILISHEQVDGVNELIKKAGNQKLAAMCRANNFHQGILIKEWEQKKLRMEIEALQGHLDNLQSIKVTRDIQLFLSRQAEGTEDKSILSLEQELDQLKQSHEKTIHEIQKQLDDLDKKISTQNKENQRLDTKVTDLNIDVNEQQLLRDLEFESRQTETAKQRMTSIVRRSQLVAIIQKQHSEILALQMELELLRLKTYPTLI